MDSVKVATWSEVPERTAVGVRVTDATQLDDALKDALAHDGPAMVEVVTDPDLV